MPAEAAVLHLHQGLADKVRQRGQVDRDRELLAARNSSASSGFSSTSTDSRRIISRIWPIVGRLRSIQNTSSRKALQSPATQPISHQRTRGGATSGLPELLGSDHAP